MTPIKTITDIINKNFVRMDTYILLMAIPWLTYLIFDIFTSFDFVEKGLITLFVYILLRTWLIQSLKKHSLKDIVEFNRQRDVENHEFAKLVLDGKVYTDNRIMDIVKEMGKIMCEEENGNNNRGA